MNTTLLDNTAQQSTKLFSMENIITFFTGLYTFINIIRAIYGIQVTRMQELNNKKEKTSLRFLVSEQRLKRLIKEQVEYRKLSRIEKERLEKITESKLNSV